MKNFNLVILLISIMRFGNTQDTIRIEDILNKIRKEGPSVKTSKENESSNQTDAILNLFNDALEPYVYRCEVQYTITKDNKSFGKEDADYFGKSMGYAINTKGGIFINASILRPWESDSDFKDYKNEYQPKIYKVKLSRESDKNANLELTEEQIIIKETNNGIGLIEIKESKLEALELSSSKELNGFIMLCYNSKEKNAKSAKVTSIFYKPNWINGKAQITFKTDNLEAGFYFTLIPKNGSIGIRLAGITSTNDKNQIELLQIKDIDNSEHKSKLIKDTQDKKSKAQLKEIKSKKTK